ncbi:MAG: T9SS type A sorting domain-containing protein, partial [Flavobacteriia bacterium]|nr:T9SS type A sorting domain-containing protein [Flavobacteriia bacterium]
ISGLTQLTQYDVYIYADCGVGLQSIGLFGTFMTPPYCSNPTAMFNSTAIDSIFTSWVWSQSSPSYPATSFNLQYGSLGFPLYSGTTLSVNNNLNDTITNPAFIAGEVIEIYVQAVCANDTSLFVGPFEVTMPLTNDTICGVDAIPVDGVVHIFNNTGATVDANEVGITPPATGAQTTTGWANSTLNLTTWFSFVAPNSGDVRINCTNLPYNGQAAVYSGINCTGIANFNLIAANDDEINGNSLAPNFTICDLTPGQTYYLLHDAFTSTAGNYAISINEIVLNAGSQGPILSACSGDTINLFNGITGYDNGGVWTQQIPTLGLQDSLFITGGLAPILFSFTYTISDGCANDDVPAKVDVFPPSSAGIDGTLTVCKNEPFVLLAGLSGVVDLGGTWYNPSNQAIGGAIDTASNIPGQFNYDYIVGNGVCPNDTANVLIIVDGSCDYTANLVELMNEIKIYPNPTNGNVSISLPADGQGALSIYNAQGQLLQSNNILKNGDVINLVSFTPGMYIFKIVYGDMNYMERIIKQ